MNPLYVAYNVMDINYANDRILDKILKIVSDPNCPPEILRAYARKNREIDNPYRQDNFKIGWAIFSNPNLPKEMLIGFYESELANGWVRAAIIRNPSCPIEILEKHSSHGDEYIKSVALNPNCPRYIIEKLSKDSNIDVRKCVVQSEACPEDIMRSLFDDVGAYLIFNPKCPEDLLIKLYDRAPLDRGTIFKNPSCPVSLFKKYIDESLIKYKSSIIFAEKNDVVTNMVLSSKCPSDILERVYAYCTDGVTWLILDNPNCSEELIDKICHNANNEIIEKAISHPNCSADTFNFLSKNNFINVRKAVLQSVNCPIDAIMTLAKDENDEIRQTAMKKLIEYIGSSKCTLSDLEKVYLSREDSIKIAVIKNKNCSINILMHYMEDKSKKVRNHAINRICSIVSKSNCPESDLEELYLIDNIKIKLAIIKNDKCPAYILGHYMSDNNINVRMSAKRKYDISKSYSKFKSIATTGTKPQEQTANLEDFSKAKEVVDEKTREINLLRTTILKNFSANKNLLEELGKKNSQEKERLMSMLRLTIPNEELLVRVGNHFEIKREYQEFLDLIDFSFVDFNDLKVCGYKWDKTNAHINPQVVYKRDLSNAVFADHNFTFKNFEGCNIQGTYLGDEKDSYGYEKAIIDENTILPVKKQVSRKI